MIVDWRKEIGSTLQATSKNIKNWCQIEFVKYIVVQSLALFHHHDEFSMLLHLLYAFSFPMPQWDSAQGCWRIWKKKWAGRERRNLANDPCVLVPCPSLKGQEVPLRPSRGVFMAQKWTLQGFASGHFLIVQGSEERLRHDVSGEWLRSPRGLIHPLSDSPTSQTTVAGPLLKRAVIAALFRPRLTCYQESSGLIATLIKRLFSSLWLAVI